MKSNSKMLSDLELESLVDLIKPTYGGIMEIGCHLGHTTKALALAFPRRIVYAVDCCGGSGSPYQEGEILPWVEICAYARELINVVYINCNTKSAGFIVPSGVGVVFIDGDHTFNGVTNDWDKCFDSGRRLIFHDYGPPYPDDGLDRSWIGVKHLVDVLVKQGYHFQMIPNTTLAYVDV